jgi:hypothetical protein
MSSGLNAQVFKRSGAFLLDGGDGELKTSCPCLMMNPTSSLSRKGVLPEPTRRLRLRCCPGGEVQVF